MRSIVVLIDHRPETSARVRAVVELALREHARLTLLAAIPAVPAFAWVPPVALPESPRALQRACDRECEQLLRRHAACVPEGLPVTMSARRGRPHAALLDEVREHGHDLVMLAPSPPGLLAALARARRRRFLHRCPAQVVVVALSGGDAPPLTPPAGNTAARKDGPSRGPRAASLDAKAGGRVSPGLDALSEHVVEFVVALALMSLALCRRSAARARRGGASSRRVEVARASAPGEGPERAEGRHQQQNREPDLAFLRGGLTALQDQPMG